MEAACGQLTCGESFAGRRWLVNAPQTWSIRAADLHIRAWAVSPSAEGGWVAFLLAKQSLNRRLIPVLLGIDVYLSGHHCPGDRRLVCSVCLLEAVGDMLFPAPRGPLAYAFHLRLSLLPIFEVRFGWPNPQKAWCDWVLRFYRYSLCGFLVHLNMLHFEFIRFI